MKLLVTVLFGFCAAQAVLADFPSVKVFEAGKEGYKVFRIPAVVRASNGALLAFCEARQGGDASEIDLVLKRSSEEGRAGAKSRSFRNAMTSAPFLGKIRPR